MTDRITIQHLDVVDDRMAEVLRLKSPTERLAIAHGMWAHARRLMTSTIQHEYPDWPESQVSEEIARRLSHGAV